MTASVFWDHMGILLVDFMQKGTMITANNNHETKKLWQLIHTMRQEMISRGIVLLHTLLLLLQLSNRWINIDRKL